MREKNPPSWAFCSWRPSRTSFARTAASARSRSSSTPKPNRTTAIPTKSGNKFAGGARRPGRPRPLPRRRPRTSRPDHPPVGRPRSSAEPDLGAVGPPANHRHGRHVLLPRAGALRQRRLPSLLPTPDRLRSDPGDRGGKRAGPPGGSREGLVQSVPPPPVPGRRRHARTIVRSRQLTLLRLRRRPEHPAPVAVVRYSDWRRCEISSSRSCVGVRPRARGVRTPSPVYSRRVRERAGATASVPRPQWSVHRPVCGSALRPTA